MAILSDQPFKEKQRDSLIDKKSATESIKEKLNSPRKEVKFTWKGFQDAVIGLPVNPFNPFFRKRLQDLSEGA